MPLLEMNQVEKLLAQAFGMKVIAWGPTLTKERAEKAGNGKGVRNL